MLLSQAWPGPCPFPLFAEADDTAIATLPAAASPKANSPRGRAGALNRERQPVAPLALESPSPALVVESIFMIRISCGFSGNFDSEPGDVHYAPLHLDHLGTRLLP